MWSNAGRADAIRVACPRCGAVAGERCRLIRRPLLTGRRHTSFPHRQRLTAMLLIEQAEQAIAERRGQ